MLEQANNIVNSLKEAGLLKDFAVLISLRSIGLYMLCDDKTQTLYWQLIRSVPSTFQYCRISMPKFRSKIT